MLPQFSVLWDRTMLTRPMGHPKSRGGSLTFQTETLEDHPLEEGEGDHRSTIQDHLQAAEAGVVAEAGEAEVEEGAEEHFHRLDTHLPIQLKSF